jgi:hypothetical protein
MEYGGGEGILRCVNYLLYIYMGGFTQNQIYPYVLVLIRVPLFELNVIFMEINLSEMTVHE